MENEKLDELEDEILITQKSYEAVKKQREQIEKFCTDIASIMSELKTDRGKKDLAELTQKNYAAMIELDIQIGQLENALRILKATKNILQAGIF